MDLTPSESTNSIVSDDIIIQEDLLIQSARSRFFCGQERSSTPFGNS